MERGLESLKGVMTKKEVDRFMLDSTIQYESIFIAASDPADAALLAKQVNFNKIQGRLFGSSGWYGKNVIKLGKNDIADAMFTAAFFEKANAKNWTEFSKAFRDRWNEYPGMDKVSGLSYDAARFLLKGLGNSGTPLVNALREIKTVPGVYGKVRFNSLGENTNTELVKIENFRFVQQKSCLEK